MAVCDYCMRELVMVCAWWVVVRRRGEEAATGFARRSGGFKFLYPKSKFVFFLLSVPSPSVSLLTTNRQTESDALDNPLDGPPS